MFQGIASAPEAGIRQEMLRLATTLDDPRAAAADMAARLLATPVDEWVESVTSAGRWRCSLGDRWRLAVPSMRRPPLTGGVLLAVFGGTSRQTVLG